MSGNFRTNKQSAVTPRGNQPGSRARARAARRFAVPKIFVVVAFLSTSLVAGLGGWGMARAAPDCATQAWVGGIYNPEIGDFVPNFATFDWLADADAGLQGAGLYSNPLPVNSIHTWRYQASMVSGSDPNGASIGMPGLGQSFEYTIVAAVDWRVERSDPLNDGFTETYQTMPGGRWHIFYDGVVNSDSATGLGFDDGVLVASGDIDGGHRVSNVYNQLLDIANGGYSFVTLDTTFVNTDYIGNGAELIASHIEGTTIGASDVPQNGSFFDGRPGEGTFPRYDVDLGRDSALRSDSSQSFRECQQDLALRARVSPSWTPGSDWLNPGVSTVTFDIEVFNQGPSVNNLRIVDYVDPVMFTFDPALNPASTTLGAVGLPYSWDTSQSNPVVVVNGPGLPGHVPNGAIVDGDTFIVPITLTVAPGFEGVNFKNVAEITYFDDDADAANGDSTSGDRIDLDSTPDQVDDDLVVDDVIDQDVKNGGLDEDDHDIADLAVWDIAIEKSNGTAGPVAGVWQASFDISVSNQGGQTAYNIGVLDTPPVGLAYTSSNVASIMTSALGASVSVADTDPSYVVNRLDAGDSVTFTVVYDITDLSLVRYVNSVQITGFDDDADPATPNGVTVLDRDSTPGNDTDHLNRDEDDDDVGVVALWDLAIEKSDAVATQLVDGGWQASFDVTVSNQGGHEAFNVDVLDTPPAGLAFNSSTAQSVVATAGGVPVVLSGSDASYRVSQLAPGDSVTFTVVYDITDLSLVRYVNSVQIDGFDDDADPATPNGPGTVDIDSTPGNDTDHLNRDEDDDDVGVVALWDLAIEKSNAVATQLVDGGWQASFDVTVSNQGGHEAFNVDVLDTPPAGLAFNSSTASSVVATGGGVPVVLSGSDASYRVSQLAPGDSVTFAVVYDITDLSLVRYVNSVQIDGFEDDADPATPNGSGTVDIDSTPGNDDDHLNRDEDDDDVAEVSITPIAITTTTAVPQLAPPTVVYAPGTTVPPTTAAPTTIPSRINRPTSIPPTTAVPTTRVPGFLARTGSTILLPITMGWGGLLAGVLLVSLARWRESVWLRTAAVRDRS